MRQVARSHHLWIGLALFTTFCITATQIPIAITLVVTNCLVLVGSAAVGLCYIPTAWRAVRDAQSIRIQHIALGIAFAWSFSALWRVWSLLWLHSGQQPWMINSDVVALMQAGVFLGAIYHLTSPGAAATSVKGRVVAVLGVVGVALGLAAFLILYKPDTSPFVELLKPYVPR